MAAKCGDEPRQEEDRDEGQHHADRDSSRLVVVEVRNGVGVAVQRRCRALKGVSHHGQHHEHQAAEWSATTPVDSRHFAPLPTHQTPSRRFVVLGGTRTHGAVHQICDRSHLPHAERYFRGSPERHHRWPAVPPSRFGPRFVAGAEEDWQPGVPVVAPVGLRPKTAQVRRPAARHGEVRVDARAAEPGWRAEPGPGVLRTVVVHASRSFQTVPAAPGGEAGHTGARRFSTSPERQAVRDIMAAR